MPPPALFASLGLFVREGFLTASILDRLTTAMHDAPEVSAGVYGRGDAQTVRRVRELSLAEPITSSIDHMIAGLKPDLERHFDRGLDGIESASFLRYLPGDYYGVHRDCPPTRIDEAASRRLVSAVIFVNGADEFAGGALRIYGLLGSDLDSVGLDLEPRAGALVAFRADLLHEVTPVTAGARYSVAAWASGDGSRR